MARNPVLFWPFVSCILSVFIALLLVQQNQ